jgi:hypothetical protein
MRNDSLRSFCCTSMKSERRISVFRVILCRGTYDGIDRFDFHLLKYISDYQRPICLLCECLAVYVIEDFGLITMKAFLGYSV